MLRLPGVDNKRKRGAKGDGPNKPRLQGRLEDITPTDSSFLNGSKRHKSASYLLGQFLANERSLALNSPDAQPLEPLQEEAFEPVETVGKKKRYESQDRPLLKWLPFRQDFLNASLRQDGRGQHKSQCSSCLTTNPVKLVRCFTCFGRGNFCFECAMKLHAFHPLHNLKVWENNYWNKIDVRKEGVHVDLGHPPGFRCALPARDCANFVVIDTDGVHLVRVRFCGCTPNYTDYDQLLDVGWWPASVDAPHTAITETALRFYDKLSGRGRVTTYQWCEALLDMYNPNGLVDPPFIYESFKRAQRQYRYIKTLKRAGRGHDSSGVDGTLPGQLALDCRACPQPCTVPADMSLVPVDERWLQSLFLSEDANFRSKGRARSSEEKDPSLFPGQAYVAEHQKYLDVIKHLPAPEETSRCASFNALTMANNKRNKGLRATGVGMVTCSRHELVRPQAVGDLQVGERYRNMDYIFLMSIVGVKIYHLTFSYDISCQWSVNLWHRILSFPSDMKPDLDKDKTDFLVGKFHHAGHTNACQEENSFNYRPHVGRTEGEGPERVWSGFNQIASAAKELGPGGRHDLMDVYISGHNWRKIMNYETFFLSRLKGAISNFVLHSTAHRALEAGLRAKHPAALEEFHRMVTCWERDRSQPNPYALKSQRRTLTQIRTELAAREEKDAKAVDQQTTQLEELKSPSKFIWEVLRLEKLSLILTLDAKQKNLSPSEASAIDSRRRELRRKLTRFRLTQRYHMPGLEAWVTMNPKVGSSTNPEDEAIWPPSALPSSVIVKACSADLRETEHELRLGSAFQRLEDLRTHLRYRTELQRFKKGNLFGQVAHTKSLETQAKVERKIRVAHTLYNYSYDALLNLGIAGDWQKELRYLDKDDVVGLSERLLQEEERVEGVNMVDSNDSNLWCSLVNHILRLWSTINS